MRQRIALFGLLLAFCVSPAFADLAAIHDAALPQEAPILAALKDARALETDCRYWQPTWKHPEPKDAVARRMQTDLATLEAALKTHPENAELALLTAIVAHYAYNVDVANSQEPAIHALDQAHALSPRDFRVEWSQASFLCQTSEKNLDGAREMLGIEADTPPDQIPAAFWSDYFECATATAMPAHALRAAAHLEQLHAPDLAYWQPVIDALKKLSEPYDPQKHLTPDEVWTGTKSGGDIIVTGTSCGLRFHIKPEWRANRLDLSNGSCVAYFSSGPYKAVIDNLNPSILVMVQHPQPGETLETYLQRFMQKGTFTPYTPSHCPAQHCIALQAVQPGMYKADGDGHGRVLVFERDEPEYSGLALEYPHHLPAPKGANVPQAFHPLPVPQRMPGKLFYLILLDAAASIEKPAYDDFDYFIANLVVD